jgi:predicted MFS family arabinose efflux permease
VTGASWKGSVMSSPSLTPPVVLLLSVTAGTAVASVYFVQPLLDTIANDLNVSAGAAGLLVTAGQIGFAFGLALLVPLGDLLDRRRLIAGMLAVSALVSLAAGLAPTFSVLCAVLVLVGITSAAAQIVVPFAASLAAEDQRGRVTGTVMSGLLLRDRRLAPGVFRRGDHGRTPRIVGVADAAVSDGTGDNLLRWTAALGAGSGS